MALRKEPGVEGSISQQTTTRPVEASLNILVPVDSPSGVSEPQLMTSVNQFYTEYGSSTAPSASDHISMLQAASLLNSTAVWTVRCHNNKVYEGITDKGERFFVDKNLNYIRTVTKLNIDPVDTLYNNMYLVFSNVLVYTGEKPSIEGVTQEINLDITNPTYAKFFDTFMGTAIDPTILQVMIVGSADKGYKIYSNKELTETSANIVGYTCVETPNTAEINLALTGELSQANYIMLNDMTYHIEGEHVNINTYPSEDESISFVHNTDIESTQVFYGYFADILLKKYSDVLIGLNGKINYSFIDGSDTTLTINVSSDIDGVTFDAETNTLSLLPNVDLISKGFVKVAIGEKSYLVYIGAKNLDLTADLEFKIEEESVSPYKLLAQVLEYNSDFKAAFPDYLENYSLTNSSSDLTYKIDLSKLVDYSYDLSAHDSEQSAPGTFSIVSSYRSSFNDVTTNTNSNLVTDVSIIINDTEYIVGNPETTKSTIVRLSSSPLSINELAEALKNALPASLNAYVSNNLVSSYTTSSKIPEVKATGVSVDKIISTYPTVEEDNAWGIILKFNSRAKVAQFSYTFDTGTGLYDLTGTVNGDSYEASIQFEDASRTDGYGTSLYYQYFNDQFDKMEIIPMNGIRTKTSFTSPLFGNNIQFGEASTSDLDEALRQLKSYKLTKWEVILDGGFISPAGYQVLNKNAIELHALVDGGCPKYSQINDVVSWRNNLPANTWNITLAYPDVNDSSFDGFSVKLSPAVQHVKKIVDNINASVEFNPIFGATPGVIAGRPIYNVNDEDDRNDLLSAGINTVYYSKELKHAYLNDNSTLCTDEGPMQEENIVRMANAGYHVAEMWLELNAVGKFNKLKLRTSIMTDVRKTIQTRLSSAEPCYRDLEVICDETNGNNDSKTEVIVDAYLTPFRSTKRIKLFEIIKSLEPEEE